MQNVFIIDGGYKSFRRFVLNFFKQNFHLNVLGGYTGSGKTNILIELKKKGFQVIDLEELANHKGSAFGAINQPDQPTVEQFENNLFEAWRILDSKMPVWIEDESHKIGRVVIPLDLYRQIREQELFFLEIPREERAKLLVEEYTHCDKELLEEGIIKVKKRLGGLDTKQALNFLAEEKFYDVALIMLRYYDKAYCKGLSMRDKTKVNHIFLENTNPVKNAQRILQKIQENG